MNILLGFLPFLIFAVLSILQGAAALGLIAGAAVSAGLMIRALMQGGSPKILEAGTFILFAALALYVVLAGRELSVVAVRLCVDIGLLAIILISMAARRPFTLQYAREQVAEEHWTSERFIRTNYAITAGWAVAFLVMVIAESVMLSRPELPRRWGTIVIVAAILGGMWFTKKRTAASRAAARS
jgi:NAD(P)-dependent dehydrogenase (short-subunit alcohol dehydrogenase family)